MSENLPTNNPYPTPDTAMLSRKLECTWTCGDPDMSIWQTECGKGFTFDYDGPEENGMKFCCYCGKPLNVVEFKEIEDGE